jgi:hypothetical protein
METKEAEEICEVPVKLEEVLDILDDVKYELNTIEWISTQIRTDVSNFKFSLKCLFLAGLGIALFYPQDEMRYFHYHR